MINAVQSWRIIGFSRRGPAQPGDFQSPLRQFLGGQINSPTIHSLNGALNNVRNQVRDLGALDLIVNGKRKSSKASPGAEREDKGEREKLRKKKERKAER